MEEWKSLEKQTMHSVHYSFEHFAIRLQPTSASEVAENAITECGEPWTLSSGEPKEPNLYCLLKRHAGRLRALENEV